VSRWSRAPAAIQASGAASAREEASNVAAIAPWHSIRYTLVASSARGDDPRVYHDDDECPDGHTVELRYREAGTGALAHCEECKRRGNGSGLPRQPTPFPDYPVPVVDSSLYQDALDAIAEDGTAHAGNGTLRALAERRVVARLVPEPEVVRVVIRGLRVGYLTSEDAQRYRRLLPDAPSSVPALIVGTWDWDPRKPGTRSYEVWLALRLRS
jgi:hypothetical protein